MSEVREKEIRRERKREGEEKEKDKRKEKKTYKWVPLVSSLSHFLSLNQTQNGSIPSLVNQTENGAVPSHKSETEPSHSTLNSQPNAA